MESAKKSSITLPVELEKALRKTAEREHRTLSGILQEAARYYLHVRQWEQLQQKAALQAVRLGIRSEEEVDKLIHQNRKKK